MKNGGRSMGKPTESSEDSDKMETVSEQPAKKEAEAIKKKTMAPEIRKIIKIGNEIADKRKRPLLLMFYSPASGEIASNDKEYLNDLLSQLGSKKLESLDVILHTMGGHPNAAYLLAHSYVATLESLGLLFRIMHIAVEH